MKILLVGATGAIGQPLLRRLMEHGHDVVATTRSAEKADLLRRIGVHVQFLDLLDRQAVAQAVGRSRPHVILHQATALSGRPRLRNFDHWFAATNALRTRGIDHLIEAATAHGVEAVVAQSFTGWNNARTGSAVKTEDDPLEAEPLPSQTRTLGAIRHLEHAVLAAHLRGIVLRYGAFYGPGASESMIELVRRRMLPLIGNGEGVWSWIHVDDAAAATVAAIERGDAGIYHVVDDEPAKVSEWLPTLADAIGAKPPLRIPAWAGRLLAGAAAARWMTEGRGASNAKAKRELRLQLKYPTWREGFRHGVSRHLS